MNSSNKTFLKSKKCVVYLILVACSTGLIVTAVFNHYSAEVVAEMVRTYGLAVGGASLALISGQAWIDKTAVGTPEMPEKDTKTK